MMRLTPRYDGPAILRFEGPVGDPAVALLRQRRRLGELVGTLSDAEWASASRCDQWSAGDVILHLVGVTEFWVASAKAALAGTPTRYLTGFDPVVTPALLVEGSRGPSRGEVLTRYSDGVEQLGGIITGLDESQWLMSAEAPPGHIALHAVARHALWDAWIHERDVALPLGVTPVEEPDEVIACLEYVAGLGPSFLATGGPTRTGAVVFDGTTPDAHVVVELGESVVVHKGDAPAGAVRINGPTVELVEALSFRAPFTYDVADSDRWLLGGLGTAFDQAPADIAP